MGVNLEDQQITRLVDTALISPLGSSLAENFSAILQHKSGIRLIDDERFFKQPILASKIDDDRMEYWMQRYNCRTRFDSLLLACAERVKQNAVINFSGADCLLILSTTKGNIELLASDLHHPDAALAYSGERLRTFLGNPNPVMIVSNACISGVSATIVAKRYLAAALYKHVVVFGCDVLSKFVLSGFQSFKAIAHEACRPFDRHRDGVVLGEAAGAMVFSRDLPGEIVVGEGCISNDANHISGPSKTGIELSYCLQQVLKRASLNPGDIDFISAHGTATPYNDEMESKAIALANLGKVPLFSVKAHFGHTLGASGVIETIIATECLLQNTILPSLGYHEHGVSADVLVNREVVKKPLFQALKTSSGFGGCNAALLIHKAE